MTDKEAMKLALDALEANYLLVNGTETHGGLEQCLDGYYSSCFDTDPINKQTEEAITALKEALAQPEQEPVAFASHGVINWIADKQFQHEADLYTTPPQRKPLTDEQIYDMYNEPRSDAEMIAFARAIEAAHGIKENT
jgi:hypothetical protein